MTKTKKDNKKVVETTKEINTPKHAKKENYFQKYYELLEEIVLNKELNMFEYVGSQEEAINTQHIYSVSLYRKEMIKYVQKYGYDLVNEFALTYAKKIEEKSKTLNYNGAEID